MSVIIKSDNIANKYFGTAKMLGTTAQAEFDKYKARVLADGGVIKDETRTLAAFELLFNSRMYGNMNTCVSGTFGVKTNSGGGITNLYAIDGRDLLGIAYGTGTLPTLTADNNISFAANSASSTLDGAMFTTADKHIMSKVGSFGYAINMENSGTASSRVASLSTRNESGNLATIAQLSADLQFVGFDIQTGVLQTTLNHPTIQDKLAVGTRGYPPVSFLNSTTDGAISGSRDGSEITHKLLGAPFNEIQSEKFYLELGGFFRSDRKYFTDAIVTDFMCFNHATREQSTQLSKFT